ncbi:MAG: 1,2-phenylacetyl-CoA epoxidase subunit PaaD [Phycisphaerae bacterium]
MATVDDIDRALRTILDPEMPVNIVDLGIVHAVRVDDAGDAAIDITPTFVGCPALKMLEDMIRERVSALPDVKSVRVSFVYQPAWSVDRISDAGRESLRQHGVTTPRRRPVDAPSPLVALTHGGKAASPVSAADLSPACPFCGSDATDLESPFGPTRCRMIYYCHACKNSFEHLKPI